MAVVEDTKVQAGGQKLKVFISYSRRDLDFADQLAAVLEWQGFQVIIDRKGIHGAENWEGRLGQLILESDTVVFVLSPDSAASDICKWEVEEAARRAKRIVPILCRPLGEAKPHQILRDLNYIHFYSEKDMPGSGFGMGLVKLTEALKADVGWLREHTRLEELAARWEANKRIADLLVRGSELAAYKSWRARKPGDAPDLTPLQRAFLGASEEEEAARASTERKRLDEMAAAQAERQKALDEAQAALKREAEAQKREVEAQAARIRFRRIIQWGGGIVAVLTVAAALGFAAVQQQNLAKQGQLTAQAESERAEALKQKGEAERQKAEAEQQRAEAEKRKAEAEQQTQIAEKNFRDGQTTESHFRAEQAKLAGHGHVTAMLLALEGLPDSASSDKDRQKRDFVNEPWFALYGAHLKQLERTVLSGHTNWVDSAAFSADGSRIVTASGDKTARLWDRDGKPLAVLEGHTRSVSSAAFSADGSRIVTASWDKTARLWDRDGKPLAVLEGHTDSVSSAAFSADGSRIVTDSWDNTARLWDRDGKPLAVLEGHTERVRSAAFSADGGRIVTASGDKTARLWDRDGKPLAVLEGHTDSVSSAAFSADGGRIVTASGDKTARLWDRDGKPLAVLEGHTERVSSAAFSADGGRIVTASGDKTARLWDRDGKPLAVLEGHTERVSSAAFSADGGRIVTASDDNTARLWDRDGKPLAVLEGHTDSVSSAAFSADGSRIVTASWDNTARLWDRDGKPLAVLEGHTGTVSSAAFSADGALIITASLDATARLWRAYPDPQELINVAKEHVPRCLTPKQRAEFFLSPDPPEWCKSMGKWPYDAATLAADANAQTHE